jgi:ABC-2 type transport system permease protein
MSNVKTPGDAVPRNQRMPGFLQTLARIPPLCYENKQLRASTASVDKMAALRYAAVIGIFAAVIFVLGSTITTWSE